MERGYLWSIHYTRCKTNGKCENLRMEIQFAVYSKTKNILMYFSEVDKSIINKVINRVDSNEKQKWIIELGTSQKKVGFLQKEKNQLFIIHFQTVSEAYDCLAILRDYGYMIELKDPSLLPSIIPESRLILPSFPSQMNSIDEECSTDTPLPIHQSSSININNDEEILELLKKIKNQQSSSKLVQRIQLLLNNNSIV